MFIYYYLPWFFGVTGLSVLCSCSQMEAGTNGSEVQDGSLEVESTSLPTKIISDLHFLICIVVIIKAVSEATTELHKTTFT